MKPKKNPKADIRRHWVLFLQIGLIVTLFCALQAFQWKTYASAKTSPDILDLAELPQEEIPVTLHEKTPPPPPPPVETPEINIAPDEADVEEDDIASTEINLDDLVEPEDIIEVKPHEEVETVPFAFIEDVPLFPGCEELEHNSERKSCMSDKISRFISKEFDTRLGEKLGLSGINTVTVLFVVNEQGKVEKVQARAPHPKLEEEAMRVISKLPVMQPGRQRGKSVPVSYAIPIRFKVQ